MCVCVSVLSACCCCRGCLDPQPSPTCCVYSLTGVPLPLPLPHMACLPACLPTCLCQVDMLNTEAHNARLKETLQLLDEELADKADTIEKYELEIKRRNDEIEKKTREIDLLNRRWVRAWEGG